VFNPYNRNQVKYVSLDPEDVDVIVFWTKHAGTFRKKLHILDDLGYKYYFQHTLVQYNKEIETRVPQYEKLQEDFIELADKVGPKKIIWRYDPIIISKEYSPQRHIELFGKIAEKVRGATNRVVISIVDYYQKTLRNMKTYNIHGALDEHPEDRIGFDDFIKSLADISIANGLEIKSCSEPIDMEEYGVKHGKCIDDEYIKNIFDLDVTHKKDPGHRIECGCVQSIDIGVYDTCLHGCQYCYATKDHKSAKKNYSDHDPNSPSLLGWYDAEAPKDYQQKLNLL